MPRFNIQELIPCLLAEVPEILEAYDEIKREYTEGMLKWSEQDHKDMREITRMNQLPEKDYTLPGIYLVFEDLLIPFLFRLLREGDLNRLAEIMNWIEELATIDDLDIRSLVAGGFCEPLITTHRDKISSFHPLMGVHTRQLCQGLFTMFIIDENTKKTFGVK